MIVVDDDVYLLDKCSVYTCGGMQNKIIKEKTTDLRFEKKNGDVADH